MRGHAVFAALPLLVPLKPTSQVAALRQYHRTRGTSSLAAWQSGYCERGVFSGREPLEVPEGIPLAADGVTCDAAYTNSPAGGRDAGRHFHHDTVAKKVVLLTNYVKPRLWLYDMTTNPWTDPKPKGDIPSGSRPVDRQDARMAQAAGLRAADAEVPPAPARLGARRAAGLLPRASTRVAGQRSDRAGRRGPPGTARRGCRHRR